MIQERSKCEIQMIEELEVKQKNKYTKDDKKLAKSLQERNALTCCLMAALKHKH